MKIFTEGGEVKIRFSQELGLINVWFGLDTGYLIQRESDQLYFDTDGVRQIWR